MRAHAVFGAAAAAALTAAVVLACSSSAPQYPACARDEQCAVSGKHDYCLDGRCVYCRTSVDCKDRERCRKGACEPDPNAPPPVPDAGEDAADDAAPEDEAGQDQKDDAPPESPRHVLPQGVRRFFRP
jgi:hypothetical protein